MPSSRRPGLNYRTGRRGLGAAGGFIPTHLSGCVLWLRADAVTVSGSDISQIDDASGNANHATASGTARPTVDSINGTAAYLIDGGVHAVPTLTSEVTTARTIFLVYDRTGLATPPTLSSILGSDATYYDLAGGATQPNMFDGAHTSANLRGVSEGGTAEVRINGDWAEIVTESSGATKTQKPATPSVVTLIADGNLRFDNLGMDRVTSRVDHSRRGDLIVYSSVLTAREIMQVERFLAAKSALAPALTDNVLVFAGNSIVAGQGVTLGITDFTSIAKAALDDPDSWKAPNVRAYNVGVGGQTTAQMLTADRTSVDRKLSEYHPANVVILFEGTNDLYYGASAATTLANLLAEYQNVKNACPGVIVGVGSILPRSQGATPGTFNADRATVNAGLASAIGSDVVDFAADATMGPDGASDNATYYQDGTHPTVAGHAILGQIAADWINAQSPGNIWTPDTDPDLIAWLDPDSPAAGAVTTWTARAGSGSWAPTQAVAGQRPTAVAGAGLAGGAVIRFTAASSQLLVQATGAANQPCTVLTLVKSAAASGAAFTVVDGNGVNTRRLYSVAGPAINLYAGSALAGSGGRILQSQWTKLAGVFSGSSSLIRSYGTTDGFKSSTGDAGTNAAAGISIGSYGGGGGYFDGDMGHVIVIGRAMSQADIDRAFAWMQTH